MLVYGVDVVMTVFFASPFRDAFFCGDGISMKRDLDSMDLVNLDEGITLFHPCLYIYGSYRMFLHGGQYRWASTGYSADGGICHVTFG
ncbi:hypothetical protein AAC387_Pa10g0462 [Persea americana]